MKYFHCFLGVLMKIYFRGLTLSLVGANMIFLVSWGSGKYMSSHFLGTNLPGWGWGQILFFFRR